MSMLEQLVGDSQALDRALAGEELSYKDGLELMDYDNLQFTWCCCRFYSKKIKLVILSPLLHPIT